MQKLSVVVNAGNGEIIMTQKQALKKQNALAIKETKLKKEIARLSSKLKKVQKQIDRLFEKYDLY